MDIQRLHKLAGISNTLTTNEVAVLRAKLNTELDILEHQITNHEKLDEGLFSNLKAILNMTGNAGKAAVDAVIAKGGDTMVKLQTAFATERGMLALKEFNAELLLMLKDCQRFDSDPHLRTVLKTDVVMSDMLKTLATTIEQMAIRADALAKGTSQEDQAATASPNAPQAPAGTAPATAL